jgi:hypothetical protein
VSTLALTLNWITAGVWVSGAIYFAVDWPLSARRWRNEFREPYPALLRNMSVGFILLFSVMAGLHIAALLAVTS